jgi:MFS family permease
MGALSGRQRRVVVASLAGVFVTLFPLLLLVASLPSIAEDFGTTEAVLGWVLTVPLLFSAVMMPAYGRLGDLYGHRRVFLFGLATSGLFAALAALAWDPISLIVFRTISQTAGSATGPAAIALVIGAVDDEERPRVLGMWAFVMGVAPALGLAVGGPAVDVFGWRGLFVIQVVMVAAVLPFAMRSFDETARRANVSFDIAGSLAFMVASGALMVAIDRAGAWDFLHPVVITAVLLVPVAIAVFVRAEGRASDPILPLDVLRKRDYVSSCSCEYLIQVATNSALFVAPLMYSQHYDASASAIALCVAPMPFGMAVSSPLGGLLTQRRGERATAVAGTIALVGSLAGFAAADEAGSLGLVLIAWFLVGVANGLIRPPLASAAASTLSPEFYGAGMATTRMISAVGSSTGITLAIGVLAVSDVRSVSIVYLAAAALSVAGAALLSRRGDRHVPASSPTSTIRTTGVPASSDAARSTEATIAHS